MPTAKKSAPAKKAANTVELSPKELSLINAIVSEVAVNKGKGINSTWTQATDNVRKVPLDPNAAPDLLKALTQASVSLKSVPAPTLSSVLQLWHTAVKFNSKQK